MVTALWAMLVAAALPAGGAFTADPAASTIRYTVVHKLHTVDAVSRELEAKAIVRDDGSVAVMVRVPVASFRSGDANRDEHMLEAVDANRYPFVVVKGVARLGATREIPSAPVPVQTEVELHGVRMPGTVPVALEPQPDGSVKVRGGFDVSLDAHRVERPSLLFVKVDDACRIDFDIVMRATR